MELHEKVCVVTGASGTIGGTIATAFQSEGAHLALFDLRACCADLEQRFRRSNSKTLVVDVDITSWEQVDNAVRKVVEEFSQIDVLVNCAGVIGPIGPTANCSVQDWIHAINVNLLGTFFCTRAVLPVMIARNQGSILNLSGGGAAYGRAFFTAYAAAKSAIVRFTESLAEEVKPYNISVNAIAPGPVLSKMWDEIRAARDALSAKDREELERVERSGGVRPIKAARVAVFLASEKFRGLTGRLIGAIHDDWENLESRIPEIIAGEAYTLRRVTPRE
jgi:3-oxoacyl-[acyl-carrier protein] reductase